MPQLVQVVTGPSEGFTFTVADHQSLSVGRGSRNGVVMAHDPWISSSHAILRYTPFTLSLKDLGSSNGSFKDGRKLIPATFVPVDEFFVLGSTLCRLIDPGRVVSAKPLACKSEEAKPFLALPLPRAASNIAHENHSTIIGVLHLFAAILELKSAEVAQLLRSLGLDGHVLRERIDRLNIFSGDYRWLNDFIAYINKPSHPSEKFLTPLMQDLFQRQEFRQDVEPASLLKQMLRGPYNLLFPLFGIQSGGNLEKRLSQSRESAPPFRERKLEAALPARFWNALNAELVKGHIVLLTGGKGIGKTTILKQCFYSLIRVDISHFEPGQNYIFDAKYFLVFHEVEELGAYVISMIQGLKSNRVIAIDHFGYLLKLMLKQGLDTQPLIGAINHRMLPVLLGVGVENLGMVEGLLVNPCNLHLENFLQKVSGATLQDMLEGFQKQTGCQVSEEATRELASLLLPTYGIEALASYFRLCSERLNRLAVLHKELSWRAERESKKLSKAFFRTMFGEWDVPVESDAWRISQKSRMKEVGSFILPQALTGNHDAGTAASDGHDDSPIAAGVEYLLGNFLQKYLSAGIRYSDGSRGLRENRSLEPAAKHAELIEQLEALLAVLGPAFDQCFQELLHELHPKSIKDSTATKEDPKTMWAEYVYRFQQMDQAGAAGRFREKARQLFQEKREGGLWKQ